MPSYRHGVISNGLLHLPATSGPVINPMTGTLNKAYKFRIVDAGRFTP